MKKSIKYCDHLGILTNNAKRLEDFYIRKMGFKKEKKVILPKSDAKPIFGINSDCTFIRLESDGVKVEIFQPLKAKLNSNQKCIGIHHWGYQVQDRKLFSQRLKKKKVNVLEIDRKSHVAYFVNDPDGNKIELRD